MVASATGPLSCHVLLYCPVLSCAASVLLYLAYGTCIIYIGSLYQPPDHIYYGGMVPLSARPVILLFHICRPTVGYSCSYEAYGISHIFYCRHKIAVQYRILYAGL